MFNHTPVDLPPVKARNSDGVRLYETPEGNKYPSITTVLSIRNKKDCTNGVNVLVMKLQTMLHELLQKGVLKSITCVRITLTMYT